MFGSCFMIQYGCSVSNLHVYIPVKKKEKDTNRRLSKSKGLWWRLNWRKLWRTRVGQVFLHTFDSNIITWPLLTWEEIGKCTRYSRLAFTHRKLRAFIGRDRSLNTGIRYEKIPSATHCLKLNLENNLKWSNKSWK